MYVTGKNLTDEVIAAAEFFAEQLMDGRLHRHVHVEIELVPTMDGWAGLCAPDEDRVKPKYFTIQLNPVAGDHMLQCLAHEMVHVKQYATGELHDQMDGKLIWKGETFTGQVAYEGEIENAPPWEAEAYLLEVDLFEDWLSQEIIL